MTDTTEQTIADAVVAISKVLGAPSLGDSLPRSTAEAYRMQRQREQAEINMRIQSAATQQGIENKFLERHDVDGCDDPDCMACNGKTV